MASKYGKILSYKTIFEEKIDSQDPEYRVKIQIAERAKAGNRTLQVWINHSVISNKYGFSSYAPSYDGLRTMIDGMVEIYSKAEVERELNIKIGGEKHD